MTNKIKNRTGTAFWGGEGWTNRGNCVLDVVLASLGLVIK